MREGEEWKNSKTQNGGYETPTSISFIFTVHTGHGVQALSSLASRRVPCQAHCPAGAEWTHSGLWILQMKLALGLIPEENSERSKQEEQEVRRLTPRQQRAACTFTLVE